MNIVSWNVNSVRKRLGDENSGVLRLLKEVRPDVVCLQELQCRDKEFPRDAFLQAGYDALICAEKGKNGVAILTQAARGPIAAATRYPWPPARAVGSLLKEARLCAADVGGVIVASVYAPYGRERGSPQWQAKIAFFSALKAWSWDVIRQGQCVLLAGDFNIAPGKDDAFIGDSVAPEHGHPAQWDAWCHSEMRSLFDDLLSIGLVDLATKDGRARKATLFDERNFGRATTNGVRVDHLLASFPLAARYKDIAVIDAARAWPKPSDHCPVRGNFVDLTRVFACLTGSHLHGTSRPSSDVDIRGIVLPSVKDFFLGRGCQQEVVYRNKARGEKNHRYDVDTHFYAPMEYVSQLVKGDAVAWEMLFAPESLLLPDTRPEGRAWMAALRREVPRLLPRDLRAPLGQIKQYTRRIDFELDKDVAAESMSKVEGRMRRAASDPDSLCAEGKKLSHAVRVAQQMRELYTSFVIELPRPNAAHLLAIKENRQSLCETLFEIDSTRNALTSAFKSAALAEAPSLGGAERAVAQLMAQHVGAKVPAAFEQTEAMASLKAA